ncbi:holin family protein [Celeribacter indicus]|uniref:Putative carboxylesterase n=1 Tax=Celeribacter indicus TaxID=1208324 RepID=A0A0B5DYP2_9RHOB|nr:holin family protein [Celeribacter indicus]AJE46295.1 putative carboxylesterase [Celeribacter indicus]SDW52477.1 Holin of 3TMs, for gene-transfer release [Celeribacter indicus]
MGLIGRIFELMFGDGRNVVKDTAEVFFENAEGAADREAGHRKAAMEQFAAEFAAPRTGYFDRVMDALNRVPRPLMAFGTIGLCISAMVDPIWFASRMQGIALIPEPMWWLLGTIVSFYFGARYQVKSQEFQRSVAATMAQAPVVKANLAALRALGAGAEGAGPPVSGAGAEAGDLPGAGAANPALAAWREGRG